MSKLSAGPPRAAINLAAEHKAHADAAFDGDDDEIGMATAQAKGLFGHRDEVGVVIQKDGQAQFRGHDIPQLHIALIK